MCRHFLAPIPALWMDSEFLPCVSFVERFFAPNLFVAKPSLNLKVEKNPLELAQRIPGKQSWRCSQILDFFFGQFIKSNKISAPSIQLKADASSDLGVFLSNFSKKSEIFHDYPMFSEYAGEALASTYEFVTVPWSSWQALAKDVFSSLPMWINMANLICICVEATPCTCARKSIARSTNFG